ncbi:MAG: ATP-binding protein [Reyranellaceae bacterium]
MTAPRRTLRLPHHPLDRLRLAMVVLAAVFVAALAAWQATYLARARNDAFDFARARGTTLTTVLAAHLQRAIAEIDATLIQIALLNERLGGPARSSEDWLQALIAARAASPGISAITVIDDQGIVRHSTVAAAVGQSRRDLFIFRRLSDPASPDVVLDLPFRGVATGRVQFPVGRRLKRADGSFAGAVVASVDPESLRGFYASIDVGDGGSLWVVHSTGLVLMRQPRPPPDMGLTLPTTAPLRQAMTASGGGHFNGDVGRPSDNLTSFRRTDRGSLVVALTQSEIDILRDWRREATTSIIVLALIVLITIGAVIAIDRELGARRTAEDEVQRRNAVLNRAQEIAGIWSARLAHDDGLSQLSSGAQAVLGGGGTPRLGDLLRLIADGTEARALVDATRRCREDGTGARLELVLSNGAGPTRTLVVDVARDNPVDRSVMLVCQDVTARRAMETALRHSQKMESIGHLASGIAHDFNNLLMVVVGKADEALDDIAHDSPARPAVQTIQEAAERGAELTKQLLAFSRSQVLSPMRVDIRMLVEGMRNMLQRTLGSTIDVTIRDREGPAVAFVDPGQVEHALMNLAINARDAMPDGGELSIAVTELELGAADLVRHPGPKPGRYVRLSVSDTGTGMQPEVARRAAEPFFTTKDTGQGIGLGLSIVYGIAQQSGGYVAIDSASGRGTTVNIFLPATA